MRKIHSADAAENEREIQAALEMYFETYFVARNYEKIQVLFHPQISAIGTAPDEVAFTREESLRLYARDIKQCLAPIEYELAFLRICQATSDTGMAMGGLNLKVVIQGIPCVFSDLRFSAVFIREGRGWLLYHFHISQAQPNLQPGESFPLTAVKEHNQLLAELVEERTRELTRALREIEVVAITDKLTGIYNRRKFDEMLGYEMARAKRFGSTFSIVLADIDRFKRVNDRHGHLTGDEILKLLGKLLQGCVRQVDVLARWGGEEFILLLPESGSVAAAETAEKLRQKVQQSQNPYYIDLSMSFGVAEYRPGESVESLLQRADRALYRAKKSGRNRVEQEGDCEEA